MGQKNFPEGVALGPPKDLSMSIPTWAYQPKPSLHGLNLNKSSIKKTTQHDLGQVIKTKLGSTKPNNSQRRLRHSHKAEEFIFIL